MNPQVRDRLISRSRDSSLDVWEHRFFSGVPIDIKWKMCYSVTYSHFIENIEGRL